jgi:hypothetical protein
MRYAASVIAVLLVAIPGSAPAQEPMVAYDGVEIFCHFLHHLKFEPLAAIDELRNVEADEMLIVVFGDLGPLHTVIKAVDDPRAYAWLVASELPAGRLQPDRVRKETVRLVGSPLEVWKLLVRGAEVIQQPQAAYQQNPRCPLLKDGLDPQHPIFRGIKTGLATNRPSYLQSHESDLFLLAGFDASCRAADGSDLQREHLGYIFGTRGDSLQRVLIVAGQGMFINGMLAQLDNDNALFTLNALRWLKDGRRKYALVIHNRGEVVQRYDLPLMAPLKVPMPPLAALNQMVREFQQERILQRVLRDEVGAENVLRFALLAATIALVLYGAKRLLGGRHAQETVPLVIGATGLVPAPRSLMQQRQQELLLQDNLWESAQALARQWFFEHAGIEAPWWDQAASVRRPAFQAHAGWLARQALGRRVEQLWGYATRDPSQRVPLKEFRRLLDLEQALNRAVAEGRLAFPPVRA